MIPRYPMPERFQAIVREVAEERVVPVDVLFTRQRRSGATEARRAAYAKVRATPLVTGRLPSYPQIGRWFGREHSTILAGVKAHEANEVTRSIETERAA